MVAISNLLHGQPKHAKSKSAPTATVSKNPEDSDSDFVFTPGEVRIESSDPEICAIMNKKVCDCTMDDLRKVRPFMNKLDKRKCSMNLNVHIHLD